jgi:hypothetical protein
MKIPITRSLALGFTNTVGAPARRGQWRPSPTPEPRPGPTHSRLRQPPVKKPKATNASSCTSPPDSKGRQCAGPRAELIPLSPRLRMKFGRTRCIAGTKPQGPPTNGHRMVRRIKTQWSLSIFVSIHKNMSDQISCLSVGKVERNLSTCRSISGVGCQLCEQTGAINIQSLKKDSQKFHLGEKRRSQNIQRADHVALAGSRSSSSAAPE